MFISLPLTRSKVFISFNSLLSPVLLAPLSNRPSGGVKLFSVRFQVCVFFDNNLFRGNRARKVSADTLAAFDSPNFPPLAKLEVNATGNQTKVE